MTRCELQAIADELGITYAEARARVQTLVLRVLGDPGDPDDPAVIRRRKQVKREHEQRERDDATFAEPRGPHWHWRYCAHCGDGFWALLPHAAFCKPAHRQAAYKARRRRAERRGATGPTSIGVAA